MRMRRLRSSDGLREMVAETRLSVDDLIYPLFIVEGTNIKREIPSLPQVFHFSVDRLEAEIRELEDLGIRAVLLFGVPDHKDACGSTAYDENGIIQRAIRQIQKTSKQILVITDVCMCEYTDHGHCGILNEAGEVLNDETVEYLARIAVSHAQAGADIIAPSDMMDYRVAGIRVALDEAGFVQIPIMAYSAKYASSYYGPFREAAGSAPSFGNRKTYQMDFRNANEAMREIALDIEEGADFIMVKPALAYLDVIRRAKDTFNMPLVAYNVSGEYAMILNAVKNGILAEEVIEETLLSIKRAGADLIISYHAKDWAQKRRDAR
ncbi:MAG: porphobilinogen synthase [Tissierellia bacterium]|nr:porphobilinogen synthase [Tissierellia bacterium]